MKTEIEQCRIEAMTLVSEAISTAISDAKRMHGVGDPELSRYLVAALVDALVEETVDDNDLFDRSVEILCCIGRD